MLFKWITHKFCSSRLESRSRAVRSGIMALEAERKEVDKRIRQEGKQLQRNLKDLEAQRQAELQETVAFLNHHLASCQDMVQALQKYTEQAYATVEVWLQLQVHLGAANNAEQRITLLDGQLEFLQEAKEAYSVLYDKSKRQEWCRMQPEPAFASNCHVQGCANALKWRRKAIDEHNQNIREILGRIESQRKRVMTERGSAISNRRRALSEAKTHKELHRQQRRLMMDDWKHTLDLHKELKDQIDSRHPDGLYQLNESLLSLRKRKKTLHIKFQEAHEAFSLSKETVKRAWQEENFDNLQSMKDARSQAYEEQRVAFEEWKSCCDQINEIQNILKSKEFFELRKYWYRLIPSKHKESIQIHLDEFLQASERRRQAIGGPPPRPSGHHRPNEENR